MIPRAIALGVMLLGLDRAVAQMPTDAAAAVAITAEQERAMAGQARSVTRSAITTVFGSGQGAPAGSLPNSGIAPVALPSNPMQVPAAPGHVPAGLPPDMPAAGALPPDAALPPTGEPPVEGAPGTVAAIVSRGRDPFRPFTLDLRGETHESEILTPLQRYELPQLRLAAVVLDLSPPRAMLQDNSGMGYIVTPGTPIGRRRGVVKSIEPRRLVVEERIVDYYGREQTHQVLIEMPKEDKPQNAGQE